MKINRHQTPVLFGPGTERQAIALMRHYKKPNCAPKLTPDPTLPKISLLTRIDRHCLTNPLTTLKYGLIFFFAVTALLALITTSL